VRIGPWIDPDSAEVQEHRADGAGNNGGREQVSLRSRLAGLFKHGRGASSSPAEQENPYRNADCPIDDALIERLEELSRTSQEQAIAQAWSVDWTSLATLRRQGSDSRSSGNRRAALRSLGEILTLLGEAARFFRKSAGTTPFYH
jgi:PPM family protein phosphatase